jgi:hypothetical protein
MVDQPSDAANSDSGLQKTMPPIDEDVGDDGTAPCDKMEEDAPELPTNDNMLQSHVILRFDGKGNNINVNVLFRAVFQWLVEIDPGLHIETDHKSWKTIRSISDFPGQESDFLKCFNPTKSRGGGGAMLIAFNLHATDTIEAIKYKNPSFLQYLQSNKIGIKTSCAGSKEETTLFALFGFNPAKTHRDSLLTQLTSQLSTIAPNVAETKLLDKGRQSLPFSGSVPAFQLSIRWVNAKDKKYSTKCYTIVCATQHADFLRAFIVRSFHEKRVLGLGNVCAIGGKIDHLPAAITWNNNFIDGSSILNLTNVSRASMDYPFERKATASTTETTTIRKILLTEGKAFTITESVDIADGRWIVGIPSEKVDLFTQLIAGSIAKYYENGQIPTSTFLFLDQPSPSIEDKRPNRRHSGTSAISTDDFSILSMHSKAWGTTTEESSGSASTKLATTKTIKFIFDPSSTDFPPLPQGAPSPPIDVASIGSFSTVTKTDLETLHSKLSKDMAANLKECRSLASTMTDDTSKSLIAEIRAEREAAAQIRAAAEKTAQEIRAQSDARLESILQMNHTMMQHMQAVMSTLMPQMNPNFLPPGHSHDPRHAQQPHQSQQPPPQSQQQPPHHQPQQQQPQQHHLPQHSPQRPQQLDNQLYPRHDQAPPQHQHYTPEHQPRPDFRTFKRPQGSGGYFDLHRAPPQQWKPERPLQLPPNTHWNSYTNLIVHPNGQPLDPSQQPQPPAPHRYSEEQIDFDYDAPGHTQMDDPARKSEPGGAGQTNMTPAKKKSSGTNATTEYYSSAPSEPNLEHSTSETAGGVQ